MLASIPSFIDRWLTDRHIGGARGNCWSINLEHGGSPSLDQQLDWDSVEADELVCLYPALLWSAPPRDDDSPLIRTLRRALLARIQIVLAQMALSPSNGQSSPASIYSALKEACDCCSMTADEGWHSSETHEALAELYPATGTDDAGKAVTSLHSHVSVNDIARAEASVIAALSNILTWAREPEGAASMGARSVTADEAVLASIYSGINAAYIYRHLDWAHELMTSAAWIGLLLRGRSAALPVAVAERLVDLFERAPYSLAASSDLSDWILWRHAEAACSASHLRTIAYNVIRSRLPQVVKPAPVYRRRHVAVLGDDGARIFESMSSAKRQTTRKDQNAATCSFRS